jgi:hypothetical protein
LLILNLDQEPDNYCPCPRCGRNSAVDAIALGGGHRP